MMTNREMKAMARMVAELVREEIDRMTDRILTVQGVKEEFEIDSKLLYAHAQRIGGVKVGKKWMFSRNTLIWAIRNGLLGPEYIALLEAEKAAEAEKTNNNEQ